MPPRIKALRLVSSLLSKPHSSSVTPLFAPFLLPTQQRASIAILSQLSDTKGAYNKKIRRGRGPASGKGKTAGRGQKGQHAHGKVPEGFEGGQTRKAITTPVRGRNKFNAFHVEMSPVNLDRIQSWIDQGRLNPKEPITIRDLKKSRCIHGVKRHGVKLLAKNAEQLKTPINLFVSRASAEAIAAVEAVGGTVTTRFYSPTSIKRVLRGDSHPTISLQSSPEFVIRASPRSASKPLRAALANPDTTPEIQNAALRAVYTAVVSERFKYRLPDPAGRKDIEYYRDPAHRGYLAHTVKQGESPSLFFKTPGEVKDKKKQSAKKQSAKASAENRLF